MAEEYFTGLNYTLANEDTRVEYDLMPDQLPVVFSIAGSGARCLPLIAKNPDVLDVVDMSEAQLFLVELRFQAAKALSYEEWLFFMGYRGAIQNSDSLAGDDREKLFHRLDLSERARQYWLERRMGWRDRGFILLGSWEAHFQRLGVFFRNFLRCDFSPVFEAQSLDQQKKIYYEKFPHIRFDNFIRIVASEYVFNRFLYKGHFSGSQGRRTEERSPSEFIREEFRRIFSTQLVRKNYFFQVLFLGGIRYEEGLPLEAHRFIFDKVKASQTKVRYRLGNLLELLHSEPYSFVSLSDTISYLPNQEANKILQKMNSRTPAGSIVVIRSFMRAPQKLDTQGWESMPEKESWAFAIDGTGVYKFHIYRKIK
ncbi:MAG: BtaA family protein [Bdellovibrionaceae bacterium]|nr:BtaA family protein [Pseudobdellovibrionaceae bacterium]